MLTKTPLVPILSTTFNNQEVNSVSAKELHKALELKRDFSTWIKKQIERAELTENVDFIVFTQKGENPKGGRPEQDYILTLDSAKHIAMMSQSKKAKEVRNYFVETERNYIALLKEKALTALPSAPTVTLTTSLTDELFRLNEYLFNKKVISAKLTPNEIRVLSALIKLKESRGDKYILATNALIAKEASLSEKSVVHVVGQLEEAKAITRLHKRNQEGKQERRLFISQTLLAELNLQPINQNHIQNSLAKVVNNVDEELIFKPTTKEQKKENLLFAISRAKELIVEDPQHTAQYKANIKNAYGHLAILESA